MKRRKEAEVSDLSGVNRKSRVYDNAKEIQSGIESHAIHQQTEPKYKRCERKQNSKGKVAEVEMRHDALRRISHLTNTCAFCDGFT
jgi:hypothetical protein